MAKLQAGNVAQARFDPALTLTHRREQALEPAELHQAYHTDKLAGTTALSWKGRYLVWADVGVPPGSGRVMERRGSQPLGAVVSDDDPSFTGRNDLIELET